MTTVKRIDNREWKDRRRKTRVYVTGGPVDAIAYPDARETPCVDGECESWTCKMAHATWLVEFMRQRPLHGDTPGGWTRVPEADHRAWEAAGRAGTRAERPLLLAALAEAGYRGVQLVHSRKAGCSCGCSPGWIAEGEAMRGFDLFVDMRGEDEIAASERRAREAREARELREALARTWREEDAMV